jgi:hypothetical protein
MRPGDHIAGPTTLTTAWPLWWDASHECLTAMVDTSSQGFGDTSDSQLQTTLGLLATASSALEASSEEG